MLNLKVHEKKIDIVTAETFVRGTVGATCKVELDDLWQSYTNTVVFKRRGLKPINIFINGLSNTLTIPHEILSESGTFKVGVFGTKDSTVVIPTLWSDDIQIRYGTDTHGTEPTEYTPNEIDQLRQTKQDKLIAGDNITIVDNVISATGGGGSITVDQTYKPMSENAQSGKAVASAVYQGTESLHRAVGNLQGDVSALENIKQNKLTAGDNITIDENNVISATGQGMAERFELIADVTTSEELQQLDVAEDSVGNPLDLKEVFAECITASGTAGFGRFIIYNGTKAIGQANTLQVLNEKSNTSTLWVKSLGNNNFVSITNNLGTPIDEPLYATGSAQQTLVINKATGKATIIKISIRGNNTVIPAGTRLRIWGVKNSKN